MGNKFKELLSVYQQASIQVKAAGWFVICNIFQRGIQFIVTPIYTRLLTAGGYGEYSIFITWVNIFAVFATLNLSGGVYYNGIAKYGRDVRKFSLSLQLLGNICTIFTLICVTAAYGRIQGILGLKYEYILLMFTVLFFQPALLMWMSEQRLVFSYRAMVSVTLCSSVMIPAIGIVLIKVFGLGATGAIFGYAATNCIIGMIFYIRNLFGQRRGVASFWKQALIFSIPLVPHYLAQIVLGQSDRIMLNYYEGDSQAGIYTLAYQVGMVLTIVVNGISDSFTPWLYLKIKNRDYCKIQKITFMLVFFYSVLAVPMILLAPEIVWILGTQEYYQAIYVIPPVIISTLMNVAYSMFGTILFYYEKTKLVSFASFFGALSNIILNALFIPKFGLYAAGYTTLISSIIMMVCNGIFMYHCLIENSLPTDLFGLKKLGILLFIMAVFSVLSILIYQFIWIRYGIILLCIVAALRKRRAIAGWVTQLKLLKD